MFPELFLNSYTAWPAPPPVVIRVGDLEYLEYWEYSRPPLTSPQVGCGMRTLRVYGPVLCGSTGLYSAGLRVFTLWVYGSVLGGSTGLGLRVCTLRVYGPGSTGLDLRVWTLRVYGPGSTGLYSAGSTGLYSAGLWACTLRVYGSASCMEHLPLAIDGLPYDYEGYMRCHCT